MVARRGNAGVRGGDDVPALRLLDDRPAAVRLHLARADQRTAREPHAAARAAVVAAFHAVRLDGAREIHVHTPENHLTFPVQQIPTVSTVGAGDSFNAGFVYGLIKEQLFQEQLINLQPDKWSLLIEHGQRFSREVCQSLENYISKK